MLTSKLTFGFLRDKNLNVVGFRIIPANDCDDEIKEFCKMFPKALEERSARIWVGKDILILTDSASPIAELSFKCSRGMTDLIKRIIAVGENELSVFSLNLLGGFGLAFKNARREILQASAIRQERTGGEI